MNRTIDKMMALNSLTVTEKEMARLRTKLAGTTGDILSSFSQFEKLIISTSMRMNSMILFLNVDLDSAQTATHEAEKWWNKEGNQDKHQL